MTSVVCAVGPNVTMSSTEFSFQNLVFLEFIWIFSSRNHFRINISHILNPNPTKSIPLNSAHQDLSNSTKGKFQFLRNLQVQFNLIFNEKIIQYSRTFALQFQTSWNQGHAPVLIKRFPKTPRTWSEASQFGGSYNYKTKQNKLPSFISRFDHNPKP
jgi:hypothetical protein